MDTNKEVENTTRKKEKEESKIPKSTKFSTAKGITSRVLIEKKAAQSCKTTVTTRSLKKKQTQITNLQKNVKPMSVVKISKDVMNHLQTENLKSDDHTIESAARVPSPDEENTTKRVLVKEKSSQTSQKQSKSLTKKPSASDLKKSTAFGGMKFNAKPRTCQKSDVFQKLKKVSKKDGQDMHPTESCTNGIKKTDSVKPIVSKDLERLNNGNLENTPANEAECSKATSLTLKETAFKNSTAFGGIRFAPKWKSTPLKPDLFENVQKEFKHGDKEPLPTADSSPKWPEKTPDFTKAIIREKTEIETVTVHETVQPQTKEAEYLTTASIAVNETNDKKYTAFTGMRLKPKRKSTHQKPDIFENLQKESKNDDQELHPSGTYTEQMKMSSVSTKAIIKSETQRSQVEKLKQSSTEKAGCLEAVSITMKETNHITAYGGIRFAPKWKSTPIRPDMFDRIQKEWKTDDLDSYPAGSFTQELKKIPASTKTIIKVETQESNVEKLEAPSTQKPESLKNGVAKNVKEAVSKPLPTFAGLRLKPRQKNLRDVFKAQKAKIDNQAQS